MLIGSLKIQLGREVAFKFTAHGHHCCEGRAGIQPDVESVIAFVVIGRIGAKQLLRRNALPNFNALFFDANGNLLQQFQCARVWLLRFLVQEKWDRRPPFSLARNTPVRPVSNHAVQARLAPRGIEMRGVDGGQRQLPQSTVFAPCL